MRRTLRNVALASMLAIGGLAGLGATTAQAQGFGRYPGGCGGYGGGGYSRGYGGGYGAYIVPPVVVGGFGGYGGYRGGYSGGYGVGGYGRGYTGGYGAGPYHHHGHYNGRR